MKILMFTPYVPYPPNSGGQIRTFNLIKNLSAKHEITSFSFLRTDQSEPNLSELKKYCQAIRIFGRPKAWASLSKILVTAVSPYPYLVNMYQQEEVKKAITEELNNQKYDLIHVETYYIMANIPKTSVPILLAEQTIEYLVYQHFAEKTQRFYIKPFLYIDVFKHKYWERYYWQKAKKVVAMSAEDKKKMLELSPDLNVDTVPNGVDLTHFSQKVETSPKNNPTFLYVGNFNWLQNREAVEALVKEIWPTIRKEISGAKLWIVGRSPTPSIKKLAKKDIIISEDVEDIRTVFQGADVLLAPLYGGGGTRYKILEAMASGLPVVTTPVGIEGINALDGQEVLIRQTSKDLAEAAIVLLKDKILAKKIASDAKKLVANQYDWQNITQKLDRIYQEVGSGKN